MAGNPEQLSGDSLPQDALAYTELDRSVWYDVIEELRERYDAARPLRASSKKRDRSLSEGDGGKNDGSAAA